MKASEIAEILNEIGILLDLKGENPFKVRAYQTGARIVENLNDDIDRLIKENKLGEVKGLGEALVEKITILHNTGKLSYYEELRKSVEHGLLEMLEIPGLGAKKVRALNKALKVHSIAELEEACKKNKVAELEGFGEKSQQKILEGIAHREAYSKRHLWWSVYPIAEKMVAELRKIKGVKAVQYAGSLRRLCETVGDLDLVVGSDHPGPVMDAFTQMPEVMEVTSKGETKSSVRLKGGLQLDLRVVPWEQYFFALHHFTGSKDHNVQMRQRALEYGMSLSEWGLKTEKGGEKFAVHHIENEEELYKHLGLPWIMPELREGMGEIAYFEKHPVPKLVEYKDIKGCFHNHTTESDGHNTLEQVVQAAQDLGWEYLGIADHSKSSFQANGLSEDRLMQQVKAIQKLNASKKFKTHIFTGTECDILADGSLDFSEDILKQLDYVVVSVHSSFTQTEEEMTKRIIRAIESSYVTMLGHMTGRLLLRREPYKLNVSKIIDAAIRNNVIIELNAHPKRLDMDWRHWHKASEQGLLCSINPDAHSVEDLQYVKAGINIARKGWLTPKHILNTRCLKAVKEYLEKKKSKP